MRPRKKQWVKALVVSAALAALAKWSLDAISSRMALFLGFWLGNDGALLARYAIYTLFYAPALYALLKIKPTHHETTVTPGSSYTSKQARTASQTTHKK